MFSDVVHGVGDDSVNGGEGRWVADEVEEGVGDKEGCKRLRVLESQ